MRQCGKPAHIGEHLFALRHDLPFGNGIALPALRMYDDERDLSFADAAGIRLRAIKQPGTKVSGCAIGLKLYPSPFGRVWICAGMERGCHYESGRRGFIGVRPGF